MLPVSLPGQTQAAQDLCINIPPAKKQHHLQLGVGHYGVFNGSKFRKQIAPRIADFQAGIDAMGRTNGAVARRAAAE